MTSSDRAAQSPPFIFDSEMQQDNDSVGHFDDHYFNALDTTSNFLNDDYNFDLNASISGFTSSLPHKSDVAEPPHKIRRQSPAHSSTSPSVSSRASSGGSSNCDHKSLSESSNSPATRDRSSLEMDDVQWHDNAFASTGNLAPFNDGTMDTNAMAQGFGFNDKDMEEDFDFESAASSPRLFDNQVQTMKSPAVPVMKYETPASSNTKQRVKSKHRTKDSHSMTQSMFGLNTTTSREASPLSTMATSYVSSPTNFFNAPSPNAPLTFLNGSVTTEPTPDPSWSQPFGYTISPAPQGAGMLHLQSSNDASPPMNMAPVFGEPFPSPTLTIHPTPLKSRVETQIPIKMTLFPMPPGITKLHLPAHTISKPKLLSKPAYQRTANTLELYTMLICSSAIQTEESRRRAFERAANAAHPYPNHSNAKDAQRSGADEDATKTTEGGEVKICPGCIIRERKRAARKKVKKVEEEESWYRDEHRRVIVFNTNEVKEWTPPTALAPSEATADRQEPIVPDGALQVDAPMRIACYCRHQGEKIGFQVIFTIKDCRGQLIAQAMTSSIMITDDHKTHTIAAASTTTPSTSQPDPQLYASTNMFTPINAAHYPVQPASFKTSHSTSDLQALQRSFNESSFQASQPQFMPQPQSITAANPPSQSTSATLTPRNLSRQSSPAASGQPNAKKRKSSGSSKVPSGLAMTKLDTATPSIPTTQSTSSTTSTSNAVAKAPSPFQPSLNTFGSQETTYMQTPLPTTLQHFNSGPLTPNSNDQMFFGNGLRTQSIESTGTSQLYSAPASAHASRASSPSGLRQNVQAYQHAQAVANGLYGIPMSINPPRPPIIHKMIPAEGPKAGGIEVTCLGSGFFQGLEVMFGDVKATTTTFWGDTSLVCLLPPSTFSGTVAVTFKHQHQQHPQMQSFPAMPKSSATFKYIDDDEQQIIRLALTFLGHKMNGKLEDIGELARRIVGDGSGGWGNNMGQSPSGGPSGNQMSAMSAAQLGLDVEATLMKCLELADLDDSPHAPRYNIRRPSGHTMLHLACSLGYQRFVAALLARGANTEVRDHGGFTPMHFAALHDHPQIVRRLLLNGADPTWRTLAGHTPSDLATSIEVLNSTRNYNRHHRTRSAGSMRSRTSSATSLRSLWERTSQTSGRSNQAVLDQDSSDDSSSEEDIDDEDFDAHMIPEDTFWMKPRTSVKSRRPSAAVVEPAIESRNLLETSGTPADSLSPAVAAMASMAAIRDNLSTQIAQLQQTMHLNLPQMPQMPHLLNLPDYHAYLPNSPMVRRISSLVPTMGPSRQAAVEPTSKESGYKWWDLISGSPPQSPPAYSDIFPRGDDLKRTSTETAQADAMADEKCAQIFDTTDMVGPSRAGVKVQSSNRPLHVEEHAMLEKQQNELRKAHAEKVKRFRSDRNLFFIWIPLLVIIVTAMLYNRVPQIWRQMDSFVNWLNSRGRVSEVQ